MRYHRSDFATLYEAYYYVDDFKVPAGQVMAEAVIRYSSNATQRLAQNLPWRAEIALQDLTSEPVTIKTAAPGATTAMQAAMEEAIRRRDART